MDARAVVQLLNKYFSVMVDVIHQHNGMLDKFTGDGLLAIFGVPISGASLEQDAVNGVLAALDVLDSVSQLNQERVESGLERIRIRIGLHSGTVIAGNIGCASRVNYTVVSDAVNTAQRIEDAARYVVSNGVGCAVVSDNTYRLANTILQDSIEFEAQGPKALKGKEDKIHLYKVSR
jgi:class 3 adenylate cyclase